MGGTYDDRDSVLRATEGSILDISAEECTGAHTFTLANVDYDKYFTVVQRPDGSGRQVLALHSSKSAGPATIRPFTNATTRAASAAFAALSFAASAPHMASTR